MTKEVACHRIMGEVVAALSRVTAVRRIASFGSIAEGRSDAWSDVDLVVACEDAPVSSWMAAGAIRAAKRVCFYRMFTSMGQPSGRYWFADESPFHRIDISFYSVAEYVEVCRDGVKGGHAIRAREEYVASGAADLARDRTMYEAGAAVTIQPQETEAERCLYFHLEAVKERMRGRRGKRDWRETREALVRAIEECGAATSGGGEFVGLARRCLDL
jgi:hypothetical protein